MTSIEALEQVRQELRQSQGGTAAGSGQWFGLEAALDIVDAAILRERPPDEREVRTMVRQVKDDFQALLMCQAFELAAGEVISVAFVPGHKTAHFPHLEVTATWHVFGRAADYEKVDHAYLRLADGK